MSDLHFGEELLPGAPVQRRRAVELGSQAFREFLRYYTVRRRDGRSWRLVIAGDLFDFMSVIIPEVPGRRARTADERAYGLGRGRQPGVARMRRLCEAHAPVLAELGRFAAAGHTVEIIAGHHDIELVAAEVAAELMRQIAAAGADDRALGRIAIAPWFVHVRGVCWIEHGHAYDEGAAFAHNLAPMDPQDGWLIPNADYAAVRYLGAAVPALDPHGIEEWGMWSYLRRTLGLGSWAGRWRAYGGFLRALAGAGRLQRSALRRARRERAHRARLAELAHGSGVPVDTLTAIDGLASTPLTVRGWRLARMVLLDRAGLGVAGAVLGAILLLALPLVWALLGVAALAGAGLAARRWLGRHTTTSQLAMRRVPPRLRALVDAPVIVFGHSHDPRWQKLRSGGLYLNAGTWLPATRPGLHRSFTFVLIEPPPDPAAPPTVELRQWREGVSQPFDAGPATT
ncbi:MAG TPA: hypothetical protein VGC42_20865 [Kofleriaceae bacterium]